MYRSGELIKFSASSPNQHYTAFYAFLSSKHARKYAHLIELLFAETNPAPLKYAMSLMELCTSEMRLPMGDIADDLKKNLKNELAKLELI